MAVGYYKPQLMLPAPLPMQSAPEQNPVTPMPAYPRPSFMGQAQGMAGPGVSNGIYARPANQGAFTKLAYQLAGAPPQPPPRPAMSNGSPILPMTDPSGIVTNSGGGTPDNGKFKGTATGALMGAQYGGWPGAIVGGAAGYLANGGFADANPIKASGFTGTDMDQAWQDQNLARLASNPAASVASKLGVNSDSTLGKILDPASLFSGGGSHKRNWDAFNNAFPGTTVNDQGNYVLPDGTTVNQQQLDDLAGTWYGAKYAPDGDQAGWQQKFQQALASTGAQPIFFGG